MFAYIDETGTVQIKDKNTSIFGYVAVLIDVNNINFVYDILCGWFEEFQKIKRKDDSIGKEIHFSKLFSEKSYTIDNQSKIMNITRELFEKLTDEIKIIISASPKPENSYFDESDSGKQQEKSREDYINRFTLTNLIERIEMESKNSKNVALFFDSTDNYDYDRTDIIKNLSNIGTDYLDFIKLLKVPNFLDSKKSLFIQFVDTIAYIFQRCYKIFTDNKQKLNNWDWDCFLLLIIYRCYICQKQKNIEGIGIKFLGESTKNFMKYQLDKEFEILISLLNKEKRNFKLIENNIHLDVDLTGYYNKVIQWKYEENYNKIEYKLYTYSVGNLIYTKDLDFIDLLKQINLNYS